MREITGNLWDHGDDSVLVITTNGYVKSNGYAVMGRGCAKEAVGIYGEELALTLGSKIRRHGNHVFILRDALLSFPVKHNWWEKADIRLITRSCQELLIVVNSLGIKSVTLPRPGCGNGQLDWEHEVRGAVAPYLDDRFSVITFG